MTGRNRIYGLLPDLYRRRDSLNLFQLRSLTELLDGKRAEVEGDIARLYRNWFVETCDPATLPYLAELTGSTGLPSGAWNTRALVADAVSLARRKGTHPAAERILGDVSGWPVRVTTGAEGQARVEVWQAPIHPLERVEAAVAGRGGDPWLAGCRRFHPLDVDCPLFSVPASAAAPGAPFEPERNAPIPLTDAADPAFVARSIGIEVEEGGGWRLLAPAEIAVGNLRRWERPAIDEGGGKKAVVDPVLGRLMLLDEAWHGRRVLVSFGHSGSGDIGGGGYERRRPEAASPLWLAFVHSGAPADPAKDVPEGQAPLFRTLGDALSAYRSAADDGVVTILDSATYDIEGISIADRGAVCPADPNRPRSLRIEAASGQVPLLSGRLQVEAGGIGLRLALDGLWIDGQLALSGRVEAHVSHCTVHAISAMRRQQVVHPAIALRARDDAQPALRLDSCLTGPVELAEGAGLAIRDSVVDGYDGGLALGGGGVAAIERATILGSVELDRLDSVDTAFDGPLAVRRSDLGGLRHCIVQPDSDGPAAEDCLTGPEALAVRFRSTDFPMPGYARLEAASPAGARTGASDGGEIGAFNSERRTGRERLLEEALKAVLPIGIRHEIEWR